MDAGTVQFDADSHTYTLNGEVLDSVTSILKPLSELAYRNVSALVLERAAQLGTAVHAVIELDIKGTLDEDSLDDVLRPYLASWRQFRAQSGFTPILSEAIVHSLRYRYAGKLDLFGTMNGEATLIDAKRVVKVMRVTGPQLAGYETALRECLPNVVAAAVSGPGAGRIHRSALQLTTDGKWQLVPFRDPADQRVFLSALTLKHWSKAA